MSLLQNKKDIEQFMFNNWTSTEIHWSGQEFNITGKDEWIRLEYKPDNLRTNSIDSGVKILSGKIKMVIFARSEFRVFALTDIALGLFDNKKIGLNFSKNAKILSNGKTVDNNYNYSDLEIKVTTY